MPLPKLIRILHTEDEPDIQEIVQMALEAVGNYEVLLCSNGEEAVAQAVAFAPQLILLDVMMPGMDGPSTLKQLRQLPGLEHTPVIFMTAKVQGAEVAYYKSLGALDVIVKPFEAMQLAGQVQEIWDRQAE